MSLVTLEECLAYVKYEVSENDLKDPEIEKDINNLSQFLNTSLHYLKNATGKEFVNNPLAKTYVLISVAEMFDDYLGRTKKDVMSTKNLLLEQLKYDNDL